MWWPPEQKPFAPALEGTLSPEGDRTRECRGSSSVGAASTVRRGLAPLRLQGRPLPGRGANASEPAPRARRVSWSRCSRSPRDARRAGSGGLRPCASPGPGSRRALPPASWSSVRAALCCRATSTRSGSGEGVCVCEPMGTWGEGRTPRPEGHFEGKAVQSRELGLWRTRKGPRREGRGGCRPGEAQRSRGGEQGIAGSGEARRGSWWRWGRAQDYSDRWAMVLEGGQGSWPPESHRLQEGCGAAPRTLTPLELLSYNSCPHICPSSQPHPCGTTSPSPTFSALLLLAYRPFRRQAAHPTSVLWPWSRTHA